MSATPVIAALGAAMSFAVAAVLQQEAAQRAEPAENLHFQLLLVLVRQPRWLGGVAMLICGFGLQAVALANGPVSLVQPIVATELVFAIPFAVWRRHRRARWREWAGILLVLAGVSVFLFVASPEKGIAQPGDLDWLLVLVPLGAVLSLVVVTAAAHHGPSRATLLGVAAGLSFALLAILTKSVANQVVAGVGTAFASWQFYTLIGLGISALVLSQSAYQAGPLPLSMPAIALVEPVVAVVIGDFLFDEQANLVGAALGAEAVAAVGAVTGLLLLATSPTVLSIYEQGSGRAVSPVTSAHEVARVLDALDGRGIPAWVEGGWGVDALVGEATREHSDLDLALDVGYLSAARELIEQLGYAVVADAEPGLPARLVLASPSGTVDLHPLVFDSSGNGWLQLSPTGRGWSCQWRRGLQATGTIAGRAVRCITAELQMELHMRYEWRDNDVHDVCVLASRFGLPLPPSFARQGSVRRQRPEERGTLLRGSG